MANECVYQLRQVDLFSELSWDDLQAIGGLAHEEVLPAGDLICRQGERGRRWYLVEIGELRALRVDAEGVEREVERLGPGDHFGQSSLLLGEPHGATVEVVEDAALLYLDKEEFDRLLADRPLLLDGLQVAPEIRKRRRAPRFEWQEPGEVMVFTLHKHDVILLSRLVLPGVLLVLVLAGYFVVGSTSIGGLVLGGFLSAVPVLLALYRIVDHFNDNYILTNLRVMHDEHVYLLRQSRIGAPLSNIQHIQEVQNGLLAQTFNFGDLLIQTAGEPAGRVVFKQIADPAGVRESIFEQRERVEAQARAEERAVIREALDRRFGQGPSGEHVAGTEGEEPSSGERSETVSPSWLREILRGVRYFFPALRREEGDTITWRKHWIALVRPIALPTALIGLVTVIVGWVLAQEMGERTPILAAYGVALMLLVPWWVWVFEDWQNDIYQVTSVRVIDVEQSPFALREERREASLGTIQNVNLEVPSVLGRLLGYGSVTIETAGAGAFTFDQVKNPQAVQTEIFRRMEMFKKCERREEARRRRDELLDWFTVYDQMRHPQADRGDGPVLPSSPSQDAGGREGPEDNCEG